MVALLGRIARGISVVQAAAPPMFAHSLSVLLRESCFWPLGKMWAEACLLWLLRGRRLGLALPGHVGSSISSLGRGGYETGLGLGCLKLRRFLGCRCLLGLRASRVVALLIKVYPKGSQRQILPQPHCSISTAQPLSQITQKARLSTGPSILFGSGHLPHNPAISTVSRARRQIRILE